METCEHCGASYKFFERLGLSRHKCDQEIIAAQVAQREQEISKFRLARVRERQARIERFNQYTRKANEQTTQED